jgi:hypothetical protein
MPAHQLIKYRGIYLDDGVSGSDLNRPAFQRLQKDLEEDSSISPVFIHQRDRFARPESRTRSQSTNPSPSKGVIRNCRNLSRHELEKFLCREAGPIGQLHQQTRMLKKRDGFAKFVEVLGG